ncbi:hypothetical protein C0J52_02197 [Blattella germanica]|nr:hypothetical protein C0J52_02197 [Blattella germanica]
MALWSISTFILFYIMTFLSDTGDCITCPQPGKIGKLQVNSTIAELLSKRNQGPLSNLMYVCGFVKIPYEVPTHSIQTGPHGEKINVTTYEKRFKEVPSCCKGSRLNAQEICEPACAGECKNGICAAPGVCACYEGYTLNKFGDCELICPCGCANGTCSGELTTAKLQK